MWLMDKKGNKSGDKKSSYIITVIKGRDDKDLSYGSCQVCLKVGAGSRYASSKYNMAMENVTIVLQISH